jgi:four helix bundle protein
MILSDLVVYRESKNIAEEIWLIVDSWDKFQKETIGAQLVRSADSVSANIAEGYGRRTYKENRQFCIIARGSICETLCWVEKAQSRNLIPQEKSGLLIMKIRRIMKLLNSYILAIEKIKTSK